MPRLVLLGIVLFHIGIAGSLAQVNVDWIASYDGTGPHAVDYGTDVAIDDDGNTYVVGYTQTDSTLSYDLIIIKYDRFGQELWSNIHPGLYADPDRSAYVALDDYFNVYLLGETARDSLINDIILVKYGRDGVEEWEAIYSNPNSGILAPYGVKFDVFGNAYFCATATASENDLRGYIIAAKFGPDGVMRWNTSFTGITSGHAFPAVFAVAPAGDLYLSALEGALDNARTTVITKYDSSGQEAWSLRYGYPGNPYDAFIPRQLDLDAAGNLFVTGKIYAINGEMLFYTAKFNAVGNRLWAASFDGYAGPGDDNGLAKPKDMVVDPAGNALVAGVCYRYNPDSSTGYSYGTVKYNPDGQEMWSAFYRGICTGSINEVLDMAVDRWGNVYVTGGSYDYRNYAMDYATVKYDPSGAEVWTARYAGSNDRTDYGRAVAVNFAGKIVVTGFADEGDQIFGNCNMVTIMYSQELSGADGSEPPLPSRPILLKNYPNPFNAQTTISYSLPEPGQVTLSIYNLLGQKVATLVERVEEAGEHRVVWEAGEVPSGVYFYRLETGQPEKKMMILLK